MSGITFKEVAKDLVNGQNMGGINKIIFGLHADVKTWPALEVVPVDPQDLVLLTAPMEMLMGKACFKFYSTDETAELVISEVGDTDGISTLVSLTCFHPGLSANLLGFINSAKNEDLVIFAQDQEGQWFLLGDKDRPAKYKSGGKGGSGAKAADRKGKTLEFTYSCNAPQIYVSDPQLLLIPAIA